MSAVEKQVTCGPGGRILTHAGVWSPDGEWLVYDTRSDSAGARFDGDRIEMVHIHSGEMRLLYAARNGAHCGVATFHPREFRVAFILGPEHPTPEWSYNAWHRQGVMVEAARPGVAVNLDARDLTPPFTPGALRGGSHVHVWDAAGEWVSFTYEDHVLARFTDAGPDHDLNQRNVGVSVPRQPVMVSKTHSRNHNGACFSVLVTQTVAHPQPGSDEILRACEEGWVGGNGYFRPDGAHQRHALAFQGHVVAENGQVISEVYMVDVPEDVSVAGEGPLAGTERRLPRPPRGTVQRRLTRTAHRRYPGLQGPRHWLQSSPDGSRIAFLMKDDEGIAQLWIVSPNGGTPWQVTHNPWPVASAFTWSPDGRHVAHVLDRSVAVTEVQSGRTERLTPRCENAQVPRPEACVFSPDGTKIAFVRRLPTAAGVGNQICWVKAA